MNTRGKLTVDYKDADYFLLLIKRFEQKYNMDWGQFLARYATGGIKEDEASQKDFTEWAFLCENFFTELVALEGKGPPGLELSPEAEGSQKPELTSGFCSLGRKLVRPRRLFRACGPVD